MRALITGGAGFIGSNTADRMLRRGDEVIVLDDLSRTGSELNLAWLFENHGQVPFEQVDVRDRSALKRVFERYGNLEAVFHFAAQVAVTTSVRNPSLDFEINTQGTLNVLESVRELKIDPCLLYSSTNKVYGGLEHVEVVEEETCYRFAQMEHGVPESMPLDFHSPYGCSKGAADQYVRDYHRIYGLRTVVFRNSCIYGPRQFGVEDQGWLAWFVIAAQSGRPIRIFGNGKQVRDVLYIDDLISAMLAAVEDDDRVAGEIFNMGGGPANAISIWREFGPALEARLGQSIPVEYDDWRPGDQPIYISDVRKAQSILNWKPQTGVETGLSRLFDWVAENRDLIARLAN